MYDETSVRISGEHNLLHVGNREHKSHIGHHLRQKTWALEHLEEEL